MRKTVKDYIRTIVDFPHEGILFRDVTTLFADPRGFRMCVDQLLAPYAGMRIDKDLLKIGSARPAIRKPVSDKSSSTTRCQSRVPWRTSHSTHSDARGLERDGSTTGTDTDRNLSKVCQCLQYQRKLSKT